MAARAFPGPADRPTLSPSGQTLSIDLHDRYGFTVDIGADQWRPDTPST